MSEINNVNKSNFFYEINNNTSFNKNIPLKNDEPIFRTILDEFKLESVSNKPTSKVFDSKINNIKTENLSFVDKSENKLVQNPKISIYFSQVHSGNIEDAKNNPNNPDRQLAKFIDGAKTTLDLALFELDSDVITDAIENAHNRGVKIRVVTDNDYADEESIKRLKDLGITVKNDTDKGLMHNKFVVVDNKSIWTGSFNATNNCAWKNNNNAIKIESKELAQNYTKEFEEMFVKGQFGRTSTSDTPNVNVTVGTTSIKNYFAAEDKVKEAILDEIKQAKKSINFLAFSFTDDNIGNAMIQKSKEGLKVQGVFENRGSNTQYSEYPKMKNDGIDVKLDGNKYVMHHKVIILDDETVITGSFNFSESAEKKNDENILIIKDKNIAKLYLDEYKKVYDEGIK